MEQHKLQYLKDLLGEYHAECRTGGLLHLARKVAAVKNCVASDVKERKFCGVVDITQGRSAQPAIIPGEIRQIR